MAINCSSDLSGQDQVTFQLFCRLPTEIRHMIWELALPHRRLLWIRAPKKLTRGKVTNSLDGFIDFKTGRIVSKPQFALNFGTTDENIGMLKACCESRLVTINTFPVHLPAQNLKKEIRVGADDLVVLEKWERMLKSLRDITRWDPTPPRCLEKPYGIRALALVVYNNNEKGEGSMGYTSKMLIELSRWQRRLKIALPDVEKTAITCDISGHTVSSGSLAGFVGVEEKHEHHCGSEEQRLVRDAIFAKELVEDTIGARALGFPRIEIIVKGRAVANIDT